MRKALSDFLSRLAGSGFSENRAREYIFAVLAALLAILLRAALDPLLKTDHAFVIGLTAVVFIAWHGGFGPALVTLVLSMAGLVYFFMEPRRTFAVSSLSDGVSIAAFFFCGAAAAFLGEAQRAARRRLSESAQRLQAANAGLALSQKNMAAVNAELRDSQERYRALAELSPQIVFMADPNGRRTWFNRWWHDLTGLSLEESLGLGWLQAVHPDHRRRVEEAWKVGVAAERDFEIEVPYLRREDGSTRWHLSRSRALLGPDGAVARWIGVALDIDARKQAEEARARLAAIVESSDDAIVSKDLNGVIMSWNQGAERLFGYSAAEAVGRPITLIIPSERLDEEPKILERLRRGEHINHFETVRVRKDGQRLDISLSISPLRNAEGHIVGASKIARDITARRQAQEALRSSEARFRTLTESIPQIVWNADAEGRFTYLNRRWLEYVGMPLDQAQGEGWLAAVHPEDAERVRTGWRRTVADAQDEFSHELRLRSHGDGAYRWFLTVARPLRRPDGSIDQWIGSMADIDDQKRYAENLEQRVRQRTRAYVEANMALQEEVEERERSEARERAGAEELRRSNQALEQFAYAASHDLQEPLRKIQAFGDRLRMRHRGQLDDAAQDSLDRMLASSARMQRLILDLLAYSRVSTRPYAFRRVDLNAIAADAIADLEELIQQTGGQVRVEPLPTLRADLSQMRQLFQNLVGNALKFRKPGQAPHVAIRAVPAELPPRAEGQAPLSAWRLEVADDGIGFDERYAARIFEVFQRLHGRDDYEGTGVGLAICKKIVERHGGTIAAAGKPGLGSTFIVVLPADPLAEAEIAHAHDDELGGGQAAATSGRSVSAAQEAAEPLRERSPENDGRGQAGPSGGQAANAAAEAPGDDSRGGGRPGRPQTDEGSLRGKPARQ